MHAAVLCCVMLCSDVLIKKGFLCKVCHHHNTQSWRGACFCKTSAAMVLPRNKILVTLANPQTSLDNLQWDYFFSRK